MKPASRMRRSTVPRRSRASSGFTSGEYTEGAGGRPAIRAASGRVSLSGVLEKYTQAASETP
jgi:hypothetical protein